MSEYILAGKSRLEAARLECANPQLHMKQIVQFVLGWSASDLYVRWEETLSPEQVARLETFLKRRLTGEPFQYIAGEEGFWKSTFAVGPGVLIPRRETELIIETLLSRAGSGPLKVAELGAGSGNIGISLLIERPDWEWHTFELNPDTLPYLERNRRNLLPGEARYSIHHGDFFALSSNFAPYDAFVSNPPYVATGDWDHLSREVRSEPKMALDGGPEGLDVLSHFATAAVSSLNPRGILVAEIGSDQEESAKALAAGKGFAEVEILRDYSGLPRVLWARRS